MEPIYWTKLRCHSLLIRFSIFSTSSSAPYTFPSFGRCSVVVVQNATYLHMLWSESLISNTFPNGEPGINVLNQWKCLTKSYKRIWIFREKEIAFTGHQRHYIVRLIDFMHRDKGRKRKTDWKMNQKNGYSKNQVHYCFPFASTKISGKRIATWKKSPDQIKRQIGILCEKCNSKRSLSMNVECWR